MIPRPAPRHQHNRRLGRIERHILEELSLGDVLYGFFLSARQTGRMMRLARERANERYRRKLALNRLIASGFISSDEKRVSITNAGRFILGTAIKNNRAKLKTKKWDRRWRIAAFDIPEKQASLRNQVRGVLKKAGFIKLQQSIWVFPHDCEELVRLIKDNSRLSAHILYGVLERIEGEDRLRRLFRL